VKIKPQDLVFIPGGSVLLEFNSGDPTAKTPDENDRVYGVKVCAPNVEENTVAYASMFERLRMTGVAIVDPKNVAAYFLRNATETESPAAPAEKNCATVEVSDRVAPETAIMDAVSYEVAKVSPAEAAEALQPTGALTSPKRKLEARPSQEEAHTSARIV
jgi:hypothetical protein